MYYGTTGGAADPFLSNVRQRTYTPKVDHTAEYVQLGTDLANMVGSIFVMSAQNRAQAGGAGGAQGGQNGVNTQQIINSFVQADQAYDAAKHNMKDAMDTRAALLQEKEAAETAKADVENNTSQGELDDLNAKGANNKKLEAFNKLSSDFTAAKSEHKAYNDLKAQNNQLKQTIDTSDQDISFNGVDMSNYTGEARAAEKSSDMPKFDDVTCSINQFSGDGRDVERVNSATFTATTKDGKTNTEAATFAKRQALAAAEQQDNAFAARQTKANGINNKIKQIHDNQVRLSTMEKDYSGKQYGLSIDAEPTEAAFKTNVDGIGEVSLVGSKGDNVEGTEYTMEEFSTKKSDLEGKIANNKKIGTSANIEAIEAKIKAKETEIKGPLKTALTNAKSAFDIAQAAFTRLSNDAKGVGDAQEQYAKDKKDTAGMAKHKKFLGLRIGKKTDTGRALKAEKQEVAQLRQGFQQSYGVDFSAITRQIAAAQDQANQDQIEISNDWQNIT